MGKAAEKCYLDLSPRWLKPVAQQVAENERQLLVGEGLRTQAPHGHTHRPALNQKRID
jgi:hypothetical protein